MVLLALAVIRHIYSTGHLVPLCLGFDADKVELIRSKEACCGSAVS